VPSERPSRRPVAFVASALCLLVAAAVSAVLGVRLLGQADPFARALEAVDPTGPEQGDLVREAHTGVRTLAILMFAIAIALVIIVIYLLRRVRPESGGAGRRIAAWIVSVLALLFPVTILLHGGVPLTIVAIPHTYTGTNAAHVSFPSSFQHSAVTLDAVVVVLLLLAIVLLALPPVGAYLGRSRIEPASEVDFSVLRRDRADG